MSSGIESWWNRNWSWFLAVVQSVVAILMLTSLCQNGRMLEQNRISIEIAQRQLDANITPNLDLILTSGGYLFICNRSTAPIADIRMIAVLSTHIHFPDFHPVQKQISGGITPITKTLGAGDTLRYVLKDNIFPFDPNPELGLQDVMCCVVQYHRSADMHPYHKPLTFMRSGMPDGSSGVEYWNMRAMPGGSVPIYGAWSEFCKRVETDCLEYLNLKTFD